MNVVSKFINKLYGEQFRNVIDASKIDADDLQKTVNQIWLKTKGKEGSVQNFIMKHCFSDAKIAITKVINKKRKEYNISIISNVNKEIYRLKKSKQDKKEDKFNYSDLAELRNKFKTFSSEEVFCFLCLKTSKNFKLDSTTISSLKGGVEKLKKRWASEKLPFNIAIKILSQPLSLLQGLRKAFDDGFKEVIKGEGHHFITPQGKMLVIDGVGYTFSCDVDARIVEDVKRGRNIVLEGIQYNSEKLDSDDLNTRIDFADAVSSRVHALGNVPTTTTEKELSQSTFNLLRLLSSQSIDTVVLSSFLTPILFSSFSEQITSRQENILSPFYNNIIIHVKKINENQWDVRFELDVSMKKQNNINNSQSELFKDKCIVDVSIKRNNGSWSLDDKVSLAIGEKEFVASKDGFSMKKTSKDEQVDFTIDSKYRNAGPRSWTGTSLLLGSNSTGASLPSGRINSKQIGTPDDKGLGNMDKIFAEFFAKRYSKMKVSSDLNSKGQHITKKGHSIDLAFKRDNSEGNGLLINIDGQELRTGAGQTQNYDLVLSKIDEKSQGDLERHRLLQFCFSQALATNIHSSLAEWYYDEYGVFLQQENFSVTLNKVNDSEVEIVINMKHNIQQSAPSGMTQTSQVTNNLVLAEEQLNSVVTCTFKKGADQSWIPQTNFDVTVSKKDATALDDDVMNLSSGSGSGSRRDSEVIIEIN